jgi:hypothetical protein
VQLPYANLQIKHQNVGATMPLILPVHLICNTSDEQIYSNIRENSKERVDWLNVSKAHDGISVLCGGGPSLADTLDDIKLLQASGAKVFAMNGAAKFLSDNGVMPDYQVIIDARVETADLVGPAKHHLFASQVHPECFVRAPNAQLWHLQVGNIENEFPEYDAGYVLIGGAASVGNTATCLAYAMGYRNLQIYGYDSSYRNGTGHSYRQSMNDGEPCAHVVFNGKEYIASLTMKLQAEKFQETSKALMDGGCHIEVHGSGLLPDMWNTPIEQLSEQEKYQRMWAYDAYRTLSPGEECVDTFLEVCKPDGLVIDFGCGTGRAAVKIKKAGCFVQLIDFTDNSRDPEASELAFRQHDLIEPLGIMAKWGYCTDVMEHIAPENVDTVINNIMDCVKNAFFQISTVPDNLGAIIGQQLHLTVKPHAWWKETFIRLGYSVEWEQEHEVAAMFVVKRISRT